jgi:predicted DNA-binding ribbon-helix-helix protein
VKHSLEINGVQSSIWLEPEFWDDLKAWARERQVTISSLVSSIARHKSRSNLSAEIRVQLLQRRKQ